MSKLSIKGSNIPEYASIVDKLAENLCRSLGVRGLKGSYSPTRLFYFILFAFQDHPEETVSLLNMVMELGKDGVREYYSKVNARRGPSGNGGDDE